jgi:uncharacterized membrane protein
LMARQRGAATAAEQAEAIGQPLDDLLDREHATLVYVSGVAEMLGGLGLILPATRRLAGWGLIALFVAIFPANLNMALHHLPLGTRVVPVWALWARLPLQAVLIAWAYWCSSPARPG